MKKAATLTLVLALLFSAVAGTQVVKKARAETITVPDDYDTIQDAINAAAEGDTIYVKKGTYEIPENQTLAINRTLSLIGEDSKNTIINLRPSYNVTTFLTQRWYNYSDAIVINADNVKLKGFTIVPTPGGDISVYGNRTQISDNNITTGITVIGSYTNITKNTVGYKFTFKNTSFNFVVGNSISEYFYLEYANSNIISNNTCEGFTIGYNERTCSYNIVSGNVMRGDLFLPWGIGIDNSGTDNLFLGNYIGNYTGVGYGGWGVYLGMHAVNNTFYHNTFVNNKDNVGFMGDPIVLGNFWDNGKEGNYWDDYDGTDSNKDGIGDTPYVINENNQDHYPLMSPIDISSVTVDLPEWASPSPSLEPNSTSAPFPTALVIALVVIITVEGIGLLIYFKKRKR